MPPPTILALDATDAAHPQRTGIGIYSEKLIFALAGIVNSSGDPRTGVVLAFRPGPFVKWAWLRSWPSRFSIAPLFDSRVHWPKATLFHGLNQRLPITPYRFRVVTLHERFPPVSEGYSTPAFREHMGRRIESALRQADRVITVSNSVRQHLLDYDPSLAGKTSAIHHGVDPPQVVSPQDVAALCHWIGLTAGERFFLNVGAVQVRKNVTNIVLALREVPGFRLVVAGGEGHGAEQIRELIRKEGLSNRVIFTGHLVPARLRLLYATATALVFPSFEEAFGMPVLEAMSYGLPVITSNCSAMPEVGGDAALYVDPHSVAQIAECMHRVAEDTKLDRQLAEKGRARAGQFRWEDCAARTWKVYQDLLSEPRP